MFSEFFTAADSRLLFLAEFLESGIAAQRVPERIEPKKGTIRFLLLARSDLLRA
jgi:hypothetical protein